MSVVRKVLIANRGEIACRIARSCRTLGLRTVAIYSEADAGAAHAAQADEAYPVGPPAARDSYLNAGKILHIARLAGADAVHPGYGFFAENADFAQAVVSAGLVWIGPTPEVIRAMGDKERARDIAVSAGVLVVPGSGRFAPGAIDGIEAAGAAVGYPLLVKAVAGGGGIGMRRVDAPEKLLEAVSATQGMATKAFGEGSVFLERLIPRARHIEIQVFGFGNGEAMHLYERDCSLQRRFQKLIEETPAPGLPEPVRQQMANEAVRLAKTVRYANVGTVEFIVDADTFAFYFLEMNTRIQVEHPVTEETTGLDLVAMQIEFARGTLTGRPQAVQRGHAIECRIYAENPARMFLPSPGQLAVFSPPEKQDGIRVDTGFRTGDTVSPYYDPLLAKVIAWGKTRDTARQRAINALRDFQIDGVKVNRDFLIACLQDDAFATGNVDTRFVETRHKALLATQPPEGTVDV